MNLEFSKSEAGSVSVMTTSNGGLSVDHWAERATNTNGNYSSCLY
jgi:hypothetical protein